MEPVSQQGSKVAGDVASRERIVRRRRVVSLVLFAVGTPGFLWVSSHLWLGCFGFHNNAEVGDPLTQGELEEIATLLGIELPDGMQSLRTFVLHYHDFNPDFYVRIDCDRADLDTLIASSWIGPRFEVDRGYPPRLWRSGPAWFDTMDTDERDRVYHFTGIPEPPFDTKVLIREGRDSVTLYFACENRGNIPPRLLRSLKKYPYTGGPLIIGPPPATGVRVSERTRP